MKEMLGTFSPQPEPYTHEMPEDTTPSGIFARGSYSARSKVNQPISLYFHNHKETSFLDKYIKLVEEVSFVFWILMLSVVTCLR